MRSPLPDSEFLVYSSHKTGTQTLTGTLLASGFSARNLHQLKNVGMLGGCGQFLQYLSGVKHRQGRKQVVLSVFRLPLERHVASFFQWHGTGVLRGGLVSSEEETLIARLTVEDLMSAFVAELRANTLTGYRESLMELSAELSLDLNEMSFSKATGFGVHETDLAKIYLFRFDQLFAAYPAALEKAVGGPLRAAVKNVGSAKWYGSKYADFKARLRLPQELIAAVHEDKRQLIDLFYPGQYSSLLQAARDRYGR